jgi:hypothetical protein
MTYDAIGQSLIRYLLISVYNGAFFFGPFRIKRSKVTFSGPYDD